MKRFRNTVAGAPGKEPPPPPATIALHPLTRLRERSVPLTMRTDLKSYPLTKSISILHTTLPLCIRFLYTETKPTAARRVNNSIKELYLILVILPARMRSGSNPVRSKG